MSKTKLTLKNMNIRLQMLRKEIRDLKNTMFKWGQQNMKDIDELKQKLEGDEK